MKTQMSITIECEVEIPLLPNFIKKPDGTAIDVADIHPASLGRMADQWKSALIIHASERKKNRK